MDLIQGKLDKSNEQQALEEAKRQKLLEEETRKIASMPVKNDSFSVLDESVSYSNKAVAQWLTCFIDSSVRDDTEVQDKLKAQSKSAINNVLDTIDKKIVNEQQTANFKANEAACNSYGIEKTCPIWLQKVMKVGYNIWSFIYSIIAFFTIVPVNIFFQGISHFIKKNWLALIVAILLYLILFVALPILFSYFGINYWWKS